MSRNIKSLCTNHIALLYQHKVFPEEIKNNLRICIFTQLLLEKFVFVNGYSTTEKYYYLPRIQNYIDKI